MTRPGKPGSRQSNEPGHRDPCQNRRSRRRGESAPMAPKSPAALAVHRSLKTSVIDYTADVVYGFSWRHHARSTTALAKSPEARPQSGLQGKLFPRRIRRGLIEAMASARNRASSAAFPRRIRRGLIEARRASSRRGGLARFPRRIRRGLIEARLVSPQQSTAGRFPRRIRRGLIEAIWSVARSASPIAFPRRIRRGLIEASPPRPSRSSA